MTLKSKLYQILILVTALVLTCCFTWFLMMYNSPMEDVSLDLSLGTDEDVMLIDPANFDSKGWTVYTREEDTVTELIPDGFGGYTGLELGQTIYFSRVMAEELDNPTLQIAPVDRQFSVWLDEDLLYTDCLSLDNQIEKEHEKETVPKHGFGLKIMRGIAEKYSGLFDVEYGKDYYQVSVVLPNE